MLRTMNRCYFCSLQFVRGLADHVLRAFGDLAFDDEDVTAAVFLAFVLVGADGTPVTGLAVIASIVHRARLFQPCGQLGGTLVPARLTAATGNLRLSPAFGHIGPVLLLRHAVLLFLPLVLPHPALLFHAALPGGVELLLWLLP